MAWVMSVLGAALALGGGYALWTGVGYIRLDWGQAETVAGTVALSAGIITVALAAVLFALRDLARASARGLAPGVGAIGRDGENQAFPVSARQRSEGGPVAFGLPGAGRIEPSPPPSVPAADLPAGDRDLDEPFTDPHALSAGPASPEPVARQPLAEAPTVVGRYEANGASYVLFSDGTIEVETENGTHRFDSMDHLREHIGRQDAG